MTYSGLYAMMGTPRGWPNAYVVFPALVGDLEVSQEESFEDYTTVADGEFSSAPLGDDDAHGLFRTTISALAINLQVPGSPQKFLKQYATDPSFAQFITDEMAVGSRYTPLPWVAPNALTDVDLVRQAVEGVLVAKRWVPLYVGNPEIGVTEIDSRVTLRAVRRRATAGLGTSRYLDIDVVEWRPSTVERVSTEFSERFPVTHKIESGDTFYSLAQHYYGRPSSWALIARANNSKIPPSLSLIAQGRRRGSRLTIPAPPTFPPPITGWGR